MTDLFAALNVATGEVLHQTQPRHRAVEFLRFLDSIDDAVPVNLDVHVVLVERWIGELTPKSCNTRLTDRRRAHRRP